MYHKCDEVNRIAEEAVEEKLGGELAENESLAPLHVACDKRKTDFASESTLKLQKNRLSCQAYSSTVSNKGTKRDKDERCDIHPFSK